MNEFEKKFTRASFVERLNRFVSVVKLDAIEQAVYVPNTGRLSELAIPGKQVLLVPSPGKFPYKLLYIYHNGFPVMIDSSYSNKLFAVLLEQRMVPEFKNYTLQRREPAYKNHRFDFLMTGPASCFIELKSCTLAWKNIASFPDAVSERASRHIKALAEAGNGTVVFFILHRNIDFFVPNYHTDFDFYTTVKRNRDKVRFLAYSVEYDEDLAITALNPVPIVIPEVKPAGSYLIVFYNDSKKIIKDWDQGNREFEKGYYVFAGSSNEDVFKQVRRIRSKGKKKEQHIDYIKTSMKIIADIPIITGDNIECELSRSLQSLTGEPVKGFDSLYYFEHNPVRTDEFWDFVLEKRYGGG
ncbi:MAG: DNA/RNA nuclease SfsA [bacterium]|nr:DNA/RNA nuclease SfsA [bacterium]